MSNPVILCVDDEQTILDALKEHLRYALGDKFVIELANSGPEALDILDELQTMQEELGVVISDQIMPEMKGHELLQIVHERNQETRTILLTGHADAKAVGQAVNHANLYRYITKPWDLTDLSLTIKEAIRSYLQSKQLQKQFQQLQQKNKELAELNSLLEQKVLERTHALTETNQRLQQEVIIRRHAEEALLSANAELKRLNQLDGLTKIANRRRFDEYLQRQWGIHRQETKPLALILCDIDFFKQYNDTYGHQEGDTCLRQVAQAINLAAQRQNDLATRYGGEEFGVILPNTDLQRGFEVAHLIQNLIKDLAIPHHSSTVSCWVTVSIGLVTTIPTEHSSTTRFIGQADKALYKAKQQGRNRIVATTMQNSHIDPAFFLNSTNQQTYQTNNSHLSIGA